MRKKYLFVTLATSFVIIFVSVTIYKSLSKFTSSDKVDNPITVGIIDIDIIEKNENDEPYNENKEVDEGKDITKNVYIKNNSKNEALTRVYISARWVDPTSPTTVLEIKDTDVTFTLDENGSWTKGTDGYYYYNELLESEGTSKCLLKSVSISQDAVDKHENLELKIDVKAEACEPTKIDGNYLFLNMFKSMKDTEIINNYKNLIDNLYI